MTRNKEIPYLCYSIYTKIDMYASVLFIDEIIYRNTNFKVMLEKSQTDVDRYVTFCHICKLKYDRRLTR